MVKSRELPRKYPFIVFHEVETVNGKSTLLFECKYCKIRLSEKEVRHHIAVHILNESQNPKSEIDWHTLPGNYGGKNK